MAYYYLDYTNGSDSRTGLRIPAGAHDSTSYNTIDSSADTTHFVDSALGSYATSGLVGSFFYNVTRSAGALITANTTGTGAVTLGTAISGMAANDTYYILDSWKTVLYYMQTTTRTAGDTAYLRANQTHTAGANDISSDESGTVDSFISMIGCNATQSIDPWHDGSNTRPDINFAGGAYNLYNENSNWYWKNIKVSNNNTSTWLFRSYGAHNVHENCVFDGNATGHTVSCVYSNDTVWRGCAFNNGATFCCEVTSATNIRFEDWGTQHCTFDGGSNTTDYGIYAWSGCNDIFVDNAVFGGTTTMYYCIGMEMGGRITLRNCTYNYSIGKYYAFQYGGWIFEEDTTSYGTHIGNLWNGTITKDTSVVHTGGASSSALMVPTSYVGTNFALSLKTSLNVPDFLVWCPAQSTTINVYIRGYGTWSTVPTASQLYIEAEYVSNDSPIARTKVTSTQTLTQASQTDWVAFTVTFTPHIASFVNVWIKLKKYQDANTGIYVDVKPIVS